MARVVVLGAGGGIGGWVTRGLAVADEVDDLVLADLDRKGAERLAAEIEGPATVCGVDVTDGGALADVLAGAAVVVNAVGPCYRFGPPVLGAAIRAGVHYVDVCDDLEPTRRMLDLHADAAAAGVHALVGMGNSPGVANVVARLCADRLEQVQSVDIMHVHGGEPDEGPAVLKHRIHAMTSEVPLFVDGRLVTVRQLDESGAQFVRDTEFRDVGTLPVYPYPHPETITLPRHLPGVQRVTNLGVVFPLAYFTLTQDLARVGMCTDEPLAVGDGEVIPLDVAVALLRSRRPALLAEAGVEGPAGCLKVEVAGRGAGGRHRYTFQMSSRSAGAGEGTGLPAAAGALLVLRGRVAGPGVLPPEAAVEPEAFLAAALELMSRLDVGAGPGPVAELVHEDPDGTTEVIPLLG